MKLDEFDYLLPEELIAEKPAYPRDHSKLLVLNKETGEVGHRYFFDIIDFLKPDDLLVVNNTKVFPARLFGSKEETGGRVELLLNKELKPGIWEVIGKGLREGIDIKFGGSDLKAHIMKKYERLYWVEFSYSGGKFFKELDKIGHTPLPPYIKRTDTGYDRKEYQTVYAKSVGSAAAPTAGLHFTEELLQKIKQKNIKIIDVTLNVGLGTFAPVKEQEIEDHIIHSEYYSVGAEALAEIVAAKKEKRRVIAVGTTTTRVLEHIFSSKADQLGGNLCGWTQIYIYPGYKFKCIDGLITNFHLPKSTLLMLVSAFAGQQNIKKAYQLAIDKNYKFYSYGDAMLIV